MVVAWQTERNAKCTDSGAGYLCISNPPASGGSGCACEHRDRQRPNATWTNNGSTYPGGHTKGEP